MILCMISILTEHDVKNKDILISCGCHWNCLGDYYRGLWNTGISQWKKTDISLCYSVWAYQNEKQVHFLNVLLAETKVHNLCKKHYDHSYIPNIENKSIVTKQWLEFIALFWIGYLWFILHNQNATVVIYNLQLVEGGQSVPS